MSTNPPDGNGDGVRRHPVVATQQGRKARVVKLVETRGLTPRSAALSAGVPPSTFYDWVDADPAFREQLEQAEAKFESTMLGAIVRDSIRLRSWRAKLALLAKRFPTRWGDRLDLQVTTPQPTLRDRIDAAFPDSRDLAAYGKLLYREAVRRGMDIDPELRATAERMGWAEPE